MSKRLLLLALQELIFAAALLLAIPPIMSEAGQELPLVAPLVICGILSTASVSLGLYLKSIGLATALFRVLVVLALVVAIHIRTPYG